LKNTENVLHAALSCINLQMDSLCKNHEVHHVVVTLDHLYKLNCVLLFYSALLFPLRGSFITA